jgi:hypothetical protein
MSRSRVRQIVISGCAFCCCIVQARAADLLAQTIIGDFTGAKRSVVDVAAQLSASKIPVGIEAVNGPEGPPINFDLKNATVADVLNAAVRADPRYQWKESDGVINLLPKTDASPVFDIKIDHFEAKDETADQMIDRLLDTPAVSAYLAPKKITASTWTTGSLAEKPIYASIAVDNETLRQALNDVLVKTRSTYWSGFYDQQNGKKYLWFQVW